ncbi:MAG TPA: hypothetical protein DHW22_14180 [Planctomycetaceae bacterium]|nr:hypothetical protein [Planctomycetaceae bacterium]
MILSKKQQVYACLWFGFIVVVGLVWWNGSRDFTGGAVGTDAKSAKKVSAVITDKTDQIVEFNGDSCEVKWSCANALGQVQVGYFYKLNGKAILDSSKQLKHINVEFDVTQMMANASSLSKKLQGPGFFQTELYPTSAFISTSISKSPRNDDPEGTTHVIEANFQLRDVTKSITIPVACEFSNDQFSLSSTFKLNRLDYGIVHPVSLEDNGIHENVLLNLDIRVDVSSRIAGKNGRENAAIAGVDLGEKFTEEIPATLAQFEMIRVPGEASKGIQDFYLSKCEIRWEAFDYWALCQDLSEKQAVLARNRLLRPSAPHDLEAIYRSWGRKDQPVIGVSQKSAQLYCQWLSEQTGKPYRLPTTAEWMHAFELGGEQKISEKTKIAWYLDNSLDDEGFYNRAMKVGTRAPNLLGLHDMLGNASEWVSDQQVVRGGNFLTAADDLTGDHLESEDQSIWNANYPQLPKSIWWYKDADYVGFRVLCEAE